MTDEEFEKIWQEQKELDRQLKEKWDALPPDEKARLKKELDAGSSERKADEPTRGHDGKISTK